MELTAYERETIINYNEGEPTASVYTHNRALRRTLDKLAQESAQRGGEFISIFYGEGVQAGEAEGAQAKFEAACPEAEITTLEGGQPVYHYLISVE